MSFFRSKKKLTFFFIVSSFLFVPQALPGETMTLDDIFNHALKNSESLLIRSDEIRVAREQRRQTFAHFLPHSRITSEIEYQNERRSGTGSFTNSIDPFQKQTNIVFSQTILRGGQEYLALSGAKDVINLQKANYQIAKNSLYIDIADSFYQIIQLEKNLLALELTHRALSDRLKELQERAQIGRSRKADVISFQTQHQSILGDIVLTKALIQNARYDLAYLAHVDPSVKLKDNLNIIEDSVESNTSHIEIEQANTEVKIQRKIKDASILSFLPSIEFQADYLMLKPEGFRPSQWTATFLASMPLFEGGEKVSKTREEIFKLHQKKNQASQTKRRISNDQKRFESLVEGYKQRYKNLSQASHLAFKAYELEVQDYNQNLVSKLDVLDSLQNYLETKIKSSEAEYQFKTNAIRLQVASGENK